MGAIKTSSSADDRATNASDFAVGPKFTTDAAGASLAASVTALSSLVAGEMVTVYANDAFHCAFGIGAITAAVGTTPGPFPAGVYRWAVPDGCDKLIMIQATGATASGGAFKG
jgi:hypothetical protein